MWNLKQELVKKSVQIAKEKYPDGFNKNQLIECSEEVYGGFATNPFKELKTMDDVRNKGNYFSEIDGHYPRGMSGCYVVGLSGGCGVECPVFRQGDCKEVGGLAEALMECLEEDEISEPEFIKITLMYQHDDQFKALMN